MNREGNFRNPAFGEELNKILNIMLKHKLPYKDKLIKQLLFRHYEERRRNRQT